MLRHYHRYMMKLLVWPLLLVLFSLTSIIWLTQALRFIDFIINRGLSAWDFLHITLLLIPSLLVIVLPVSLFIAVIFCYHKLSAESELVVMEASGLSPLQLAYPAAMTALGIMLLGYLNTLVLLPASQRQFHQMERLLRDNYASVLLQEEVFNHPTDGLTVFIRARGEDGSLSGILVHDARLRSQAVTMMAETGRLVQTSGGPRFMLQKGLRQERRDGRITWLDFDSYNLDLSFYAKAKAAADLDEKDLSLGDLFTLGSSHPGEGRFAAEAHRRLTWPLYTLGLALIAVAVLQQGDFSRRNRWKRITLLTVSALLIVVASFGLGVLVTRAPSVYPLMYLLALAVVAAGLGLLWRDGRPRAQPLRVSVPT